MLVYVYQISTNVHSLNCSILCFCPQMQDHFWRYGMHQERVQKTCLMYVPLRVLSLLPSGHLGTKPTIKSCLLSSMVIFFAFSLKSWKSGKLIGQQEGLTIVLT